MLDFDAASTVMMTVPAWQGLYAGAAASDTDRRAASFAQKNRSGDGRMEYSISELSGLAGVSTRTLRYYGEIGILSPLYVSAAGYRYYGDKEVERLQQILFYRERGFELKQIREILLHPDFDIETALREHLSDLKEKRKRMDRLIETVEQTIAAGKGERMMSDRQKFEAFKQQTVQENELRYGEEVRRKYGSQALEASNRRMLDMTQEQWDHFQSLEHQIREELARGVKAGIRPESEEAGGIVQLHKEWLQMTWKQYSPQMHRGLAGMYLADERFRAYYDRKVSGCTRLLCAAIEHWI